MDGIFDRTHQAVHYKPKFSQDSGAYREAARVRRVRDDIDGNFGPRSSGSENSHTKPVLALNGQPYPTLPFSLGGYGLDENTNQIMECRRMGRSKAHRRRPSRHKFRTSFRPHDRKISYSSSRRGMENESGRNIHQRQVQPQAPSHLIPQRPSRSMYSPAMDGIHNQMTMNKAMWQRNAVTNLQLKEPKLPVPIDVNWLPQHPESYVPPTYGYPHPLPAPGMNLPASNPALVIQNQNLRWNEGQWLINQMSNPPNSNTRFKAAENV